MKITDYRDALARITAEIEQLRIERSAVVDYHKVPTVALVDGYTISGKWTETPETEDYASSVSYHLTLSAKDGIVGEFIDGDFYARPGREAPDEVMRLATSIRVDLERWLNDEIDFPLLDSNIEN